MESSKVLVIDQQPLMLEALALALGELQDITVSTHAISDDVAAFVEEVPDVVVCDPTVDNEFRPEYVAFLAHYLPAARIVVLSSQHEPDSIMAALGHGAKSYILKSEPIETIRAAIELACRGGVAFSLPIAALVTDRPVPSREARSLAAPVSRGLTPREIQVMQLVARGHTDVETAESLEISDRTVERHVSNVLNKLGCRNRSEAVAQVIGGAPGLARVR
jgi:DNA-binding NarL/FixJ family response regulator